VRRSISGTATYRELARTDINDGAHVNAGR